MRVGIVGSEQAKFTPETEAKAREYIRLIVNQPNATAIVSGESPLGGVDWFAREEAEAAGKEFIPFPPKNRRWADGYKERNLQIARASDVVVCITLKTLPESYTGMRFERGCYHCGTGPEDHVKSGGCWTMKQAAMLGKRTRLKVIE